MRSTVCKECLIFVLLSIHSNLLSNPYVCDCHLAWLGQWLKKTRVVSGNPRCQKPAFLKEIPIQDVATPDFTCDGTQFFNTVVMSYSWFCWRTHASALIWMCTHIYQYNLSCTYHPLMTPAHGFSGVKTQTTWQHLMHPGSLNFPQLKGAQSLCYYRVLLA